MRTIIVNLYEHVTPLSFPYNIQTRGRDIHFPLPYLIFKTSKQRERGKPFTQITQTN